MDNSPTTIPNPSNQKFKLASHARIFLFPILILGVILFFLLELGIGSVHIPISGVVKALFNLEGADDTWIKIINELRMPRTLAALLGGAALGMAGLPDSNGKCH